MDKNKLKEQAVELFQIASELCGYALSKINDTKAVDEINKLMKPMEEHGVNPYKNNPLNMTDWGAYSQKLADFIEELKKQNLIGDKLR